MQRELPILAAMQLKPPTEVDASIFRACKTFLDAVRLCVQLSNRSHSDIAEKLAVDPGHWTRMMQGRASFPLAKIPVLMRLCENLAPMQWLAQEMGYEIYANPKAARVAELEAELARLKDAA